jgi:phthiodiolone/phenolphthiodiolone dimycocerosates ketoreductase
MAESRVHEVKVGNSGPMGPPAKTLTSRPAAAEQAGYASLWWGDHYAGWAPRSIWTPDISPVARPGTNPDVFFDPIQAMAVAGTVTNEISLGVTTESVRRHPVALAQQFLTLAHISGNRTILGLGGGEGENILPYGLSFEKPIGRMEEGLQIIRLLWDRDEPIDFEGDHFQLKGAVHGVAPPNGARLPVWICGVGPRMCRIAGQLAEGWLPAWLSPEEYGEKLDSIRAARAGVGREDDPFTPGYFAFVALAKSKEAAEEHLRHPMIKAMCLPSPAAAFERFGAVHPLGAGVNGPLEYIPGHYGREEILAMVENVPDEVVQAYVFHGTPDDVRDQLEPYARRGLEHVVFGNVTALGDLSAAGTSFALQDELASGIKYQFESNEEEGQVLR